MNFQYKLRDSQGRVFQGAAEAASRSALVQEIQSQGFKIIAMVSAPQAAFQNARPLSHGEPARKIPWYLRPVGKGVSEEEVLFFTRDFLSVVKAGMPLVGSLKDIAAHVKNAYFRAVLLDVSDLIDQGMKPSDALERYRGIFGELYFQSVRAGEESGKMDRVLERLSLALEKDLETKRLIQSAVRYPLVVLFFLCAAFFLLVMVVIPKIAKLFTQFQTELPLPTRIIIQTGDFFQAYGLIFILALTGAWCFCSFYFKTRPGQVMRDRLILSVPILGGLFRKVFLSRFASAFQTLYGSGLVIPEALAISAKTVGNQSVAGALMKVQRGVLEGRTISEMMRQEHHFPPLVIQMIHMGEKTGNLEDMAGQVSSHYEREVQYMTKNLAGMIEPILTFALGLMVLVLALGVFMPMWNVMKLLRV